MTREEFRAAVDLIGRSVINLTVAVIQFTDGQSHTTFSWTIEEGETSVKYRDVHCTPGSALIEVPYGTIQNVRSAGA